jgi:hypothetical protein
LFGFSSVEERSVVAAFDGGAVTSDAGALLPGTAGRSIGPVGRFAACFADGHAQGPVIHQRRAQVCRRVFAIAPGYNGPVGHDQWDVSDAQRNQIPIASDRGVPAHLAFRPKVPAQN